MNFRYGLLLPAMLVVLLFVGSASASLPTYPPIPPSPYIPKSPAEDIVTVSAYLAGAAALPGVVSGISGTPVHLTIVFAAPTPPGSQTLNILVTALLGNPQKETQVYYQTFSDLSTTTYAITVFVPTDGGTPQIAVYAWLGTVDTDRAPNDGFYSITSLSAQTPNVFQDPESLPVGGVVMPTNKLEIAAPFAALVGLVVAVSAVIVVKRRRD